MSVYKTIEDFGWSLQSKDSSCIKYYKNCYILYFFIEKRLITFSCRRNVVTDLDIDLFEFKAINRRAKEIWKPYEKVNNENTSWKEPV